MKARDMAPHDLCLYLVQDSDRPLYVMAKDYQHALRAWQQLIRRENNMGPDEECEPDGIHLVARADEIVPMEDSDDARVRLEFALPICDVCGWQGDAVRSVAESSRIVRAHLPTCGEVRRLIAAADNLPAPTEETDATAQSDPGVLRVRAPAAPPAEGVEADRRPGAADGSGPAAVGGGVGRAAEAARGQGLPGEGGAVDPQAAGDVGVDGGPIGCPVEDARCYGGGCLSLPECERKAQGGVQ